ncbi:hypothetical protein LTR94_026228, partial [Friedmanniomyces endolithicus]
MGLVVTVFANSPNCGRGLARDMPVHWAFEGTGQPYEIRQVPHRAMKEADHLALHPYGQIPVLQDGDLTLFESGAIVLHVASKSTGLLPQDEARRWRAVGWVFSALSTLEPPIIEREAAHFLERDRHWHEERRPLVEARISERLSRLSDRLGQDGWLEDDFSVGDLMTVSVLRRLESSNLLDPFDNLRAYVTRPTDRPAFRRAFAAQLAAYQVKAM